MGVEGRQVKRQNLVRLQKGLRLQVLYTPQLPMPPIHSTHTTPTHHALTILLSCIHTTIPTHTIPAHHTPLMYTYPHHTHPSCPHHTPLTYVHHHTCPNYIHLSCSYHTSLMYTHLHSPALHHVHTIHHLCICTTTAPTQHPPTMPTPCPTRVCILPHPSIMPTPYASHIHTTTPTHHAHTIPQSYTHHHTHPSCPHHTPVIHTTTPTHHVHTITHLCIHTTTAPTSYATHHLHTTQSAYRQTHNYVHRQTL